MMIIIMTMMTMVMVLVMVGVVTMMVVLVTDTDGHAAAAADADADAEADVDDDDEKVIVNVHGGGDVFQGDALVRTWKSGFCQPTAVILRTPVARRNTTKTFIDGIYKTQNNRAANQPSCAELHKAAASKQQRSVAFLRLPNITLMSFNPNQLLSHSST